MSNIYGHFAQLHRPEYADALRWLDGILDRAAEASSKTARNKEMSELNNTRWRFNRAVQAATPVFERKRSDNQEHDDLYDLHTAMGWVEVEGAAKCVGPLSRLKSRAALLTLFIHSRQPRHVEALARGEYVPRVYACIVPEWIIPIAEKRPDLLRQALRAGPEKRRAIVFQANHSNSEET